MLLHESLQYGFPVVLAGLGESDAKEGESQERPIPVLQPLPVTVCEYLEPGMFL